MTPIPPIVPPVSACCGASIREDDDTGSEYIRCRKCGEMSLIADDDDDAPDPADGPQNDHWIRYGGEVVQFGGAYK